MAPKLYNTPNVLHNPAENFAGEATPLKAPSSPDSALREQKKMRESGIETTKAAYIHGVHEACRMLGLVKEARLNPLKAWFRRILEGPAGEYVVRTPIQSLMGGLAGATAGQMYSEHPGRGALLGAVSGGMGGLAVAGAPHLRKILTQALRR